ncbi:MAG: hypothetical protein ACYC6Y_27190 [Thermoguttaceae bacterium]
MGIIVECGSCHKKINAAEKFAGKKVKCPGCQAILTIPAVEGSASVASAPSPAGTKSAAPSTRPGPATPAPRQPAAAAAAVPAAASSLLDEIPLQGAGSSSLPAADPLASMLDDDVPIRREQPFAPAGASSADCPGCGAAVQAGAVLCVNCGYDFRAQGKRKQQIGDDSGGGGKKKKRRSQLLGDHTPQIMQLLRGCVFSFVGACAGALIWYLVARFTMTEWALISWGLGGLAGMGMALGYGHEEMLGGICAAVIAALGIVVAKLAIFFWILGPLFIAIAGGDMDEFVDEESADPQVIAGEEFPGDAAGEASDGSEEAEGEMDEAAGTGEAGGEGMADEAASDEEFSDEEFSDEEFSDEEMGDELGAAGMVGMGAKLFFLTMFGIYDVLFLILACATAFKIGSSGSGGGG